MNLGLKNRVALVAASSKGLGRAVALELSREGAKVVILARNREILFKTRDEIAAETGNEVKALIADVTDRTQISRLVKQVKNDFGTIEILVCNAGGPPSGMAEDFTLDDYRDAIELNLLSTVNLCYEVVPLMKKQRWGRIIIMASISAKQPIDTLILSNTSRAGVLGFSKSLSNQVASFGITVNSVCPGYIKSERVENLAKDFEKKGKGAVADFYRNIEKMIPMGRLGALDEIGKAVAFLASEGAAYITGTALQVDGGYVKSLF